MKNGNGDANLKEVRADFYRLKLLYSAILETLESFYSGSLIITDNRLAHAYNFLWEQFEKIIIKYPDLLKEVISIGRPSGAESLYPDNFGSLDNPSDTDIEWMEMGKKDSTRIELLLDRISIDQDLHLPSVQSFRKHLDKKLPIIKAIEEYKQAKVEEEEKLKTAIKETETESTEEHKSFCRFENNTLYITLADKTEKSIPFNTERNTKVMLSFFKVLYNHWQLYKSKPISRAGIKEGMREEGISGFISDKLVSSTIGNMRRTKIKPAGLKGYVVIRYDKKSQGYSLDINQPL